jgi:pimeloyl-ACP methyl ester carboxylesterase
MQFGKQVPTGTYLDMKTKLPVVKPEKGAVPGALVRGEFDGIATVADLEEFFNALPNGDRQFVILPAIAHFVTLATNRKLFWHAVRAFLRMPRPIAT